ncbi:hypothetical protein E2C06_18160 [Dankookia rubra]|uniref:Uncharacterized protein n=1 Tax=Dankookia rubra TaxID=1442381 RepID=A0A4R5QDD7_9PROT|nr:IcmT/TraK family protein [Dankookia rubra]TDH61164.1 hypothetical protein E2C06_18160 [Dankookia rubra]
MWRDTARDVTFLGLDAWALAPFVAVPFTGWDWRMIYLAVAVAVIFALVRAAGLSVVGAGRRVRSWIAGAERLATPPSKQRFFA